MRVTPRKPSARFATWFTVSRPSRTYTLLGIARGVPHCLLEDDAQSSMKAGLNSRRRCDASPVGSTESFAD